MNKTEFETRIKREAGASEFAFAETLYMNCGDSIDKDLFCAEYKKFRFSESEVVTGLVDTLEKAQKGNRQASARIAELEAKANGYNEEMAYFLIQQDMLCNNDGLRTKAIELVGERKYILMKIELGYQLSDADSKLIATLL